MRRQLTYNITWLVLAVVFLVIYLFLLKAFNKTPKKVEKQEGHQIILNFTGNEKCYEQLTNTMSEDKVFYFGAKDFEGGEHE